MLLPTLRNARGTTPFRSSQLPLIAEYVAELVLRLLIHARQQLPPSLFPTTRIWQGVGYHGIYERLLRRPRENMPRVCIDFGAGERRMRLG